MTPQELNGLVKGALNRSTLFIPKKISNTESKMSEESDSGESSDDEYWDVSMPKVKISEQNKIQAPEFVNDCFLPNYTLENHQTSFRFNADLDPTFWDAPKTLMNDDLASEGPCGFGGDAKRRFMNTVCLALFENGSLFVDFRDISTNKMTIRPVLSALLSLASAISNWNWFSIYLNMSFKDANAFSKLSHQPYFIRSFVMGCKTFQNEHFVDLKESLKVIWKLIRTSEQPNFLVQLSELGDTKSNQNLWKSEILSDENFWPLIQSHTTTNWENWDILFSRFDAEIYSISIPQVLTESILNNLNAKRDDGMLNRAIQFRLMKFFKANSKPSTSFVQSLSNWRVLSTFVVNVSKSDFVEKLNRKRKFLDFILIQMFKDLQTEIGFGTAHFIETMRCPEEYFPKRPEIADEIFTSFCKLWTESTTIQSLDTEGKAKPIFDLMLGLFATPKLFEEIFIDLKSKQHKSTLIGLIDHFRPDKNLDRFFPINEKLQRWIGDDESEQEKFLLSMSARTERTDFAVKNCRFFELFSSSSGFNMIFIRKKWIPFFQLKEKLINMNNNNSKSKAKQRQNNTEEEIPKKKRKLNE